MKITVQNSAYASGEVYGAKQCTGAASCGSVADRTERKQDGVEVTISQEGEAVGKFMERLEKGERINLFEEMKKSGGNAMKLQAPGMEEMQGNLLPLLSKEEKEELLRQSIKPAQKLHLIIPNIQTDTKLNNSLAAYGGEVNDTAYSIIQNNLLVSNVGDMSEKERQGMLSLGLEKARYLADNYMSGEDGALFMEAMETIAKYAANGQKGQDGKMTYHIQQGPMNGASDDYVNGYDIMRRYDPVSYAKFNSMMQEGTRTGDLTKQMEAARFGIGWTQNSHTEHPEWYKEQADIYKNWKGSMEKTVLDDTFSGAGRGAKESFRQSILERNGSAGIFKEDFLNKDMEAFFDIFK